MPAMGTDTKLGNKIANVSSVDRGKGRYNKRMDNIYKGRFVYMGIVFLMNILRPYIT